MEKTLREQQNLRWKNLDEAAKRKAVEKYANTKFSSFGSQALEASSLRFLYGEHNLCDYA